VDAPFSRIRLTHLSGPRQGQTDQLDRLPATLGADSGLEVVIPGIAGTHAHLVERHGEVVLEDGGSDRGTFLLGEQVREAVLRDGDVIELGRGGPKVSFRRGEGELVPLEPQIVTAAPDSHLHPHHHADVLHAVIRETVAHTSRLFRILTLVVLGLGGLALGYSQWQARRLRAELKHLREAVAAANEEQRRFVERIEEERHRGAEERKGLESRIEEAHSREETLSRKLAEAQAAEATKVRAELSLTRERLTSLETERAAGERIIRDYGAGVCLIQGSYAFYDADGRGLRLQLDESGNPKRKDDGTPRVDVGASGPLYTSDYLGTGFLVDRHGLILTNRHVAEPWWNDGTAQALIKSGHRPRFLTFRAFFPKEAEPFDLTTDRVSDKVDLAVARLDLKKRPIPVLQLDASGSAAVAGQPVVVLGYPAGLEALLAKADTGMVQELLASTGSGSDRVAEAMGRKGLIRPSTTQGHIGDITKTDIVFDAPTTQGGSGGPVLNKNGRVIAVEYAVLTRFEGSSFGVPIGYAVDLLKAPRKGADD
jgi:hypothetical protein